MGVAPETLEKPGHLLVNHGVMDYAIVKVLLLRCGRKFSVKQEITGLEEVAALGELFDRITTVFENPGIAVDIGDLRLTARGRGEAGVVGEHARLGIELGNVDHIGPNGATQNREVVSFVADRERCGLAVRACVHRGIIPNDIVAKIGLEAAISPANTSTLQRLHSFAQTLLVDLADAGLVEFGGTSVPEPHARSFRPLRRPSNAPLREVDAYLIACSDKKGHLAWALGAWGGDLSSQQSRLNDAPSRSQQVTEASHSRSASRKPQC